MKLDRDPMPKNGKINVPKRRKTHRTKTELPAQHDVGVGAGGGKLLFPGALPRAVGRGRGIHVYLSYIVEGSLEVKLLTT